MTVREPILLEGPLDLARFLITSLTFMRTVKKIDMLVDDTKVLEVSKDIKGKDRVGKKGLKQTSGGGMMTIIGGVDATGMLVTARVRHWLAGMCSLNLAAPPDPSFSDRIHSATYCCSDSDAQFRKIYQSILKSAVVLLFQ